MQPREARALGELAGATLSSVVTRVGQMHQGIAERVFGSIGAGADSVRVVHDGIARGVYAGLRRSLRGAARAGASAASLAGSPEDPPVERSARARVAIGALNGAFGDQLEEIDSPLVGRDVSRSAGSRSGPARRCLPAWSVRDRRRVVATRRSASSIRTRAPRRPWLHAGLHPLQQRSPHLLQRT